MASVDRLLQTTGSGVDDMPDDYGRWLIHGPQGSGKTTLASTVAELGKTLYIDLVGEKGVRAFKGAPYAKRITVYRPRSVTDLDDMFWALDSGDHDFKAVVIDSLTSVQKMTMRYLLGHDETAVKEIRQGTAPAQIQTWGQALDVMTDTATFWYGLADGDRKRPMHVVMTAQTKISEDNENGNTIRTPDVQRGALSITLATPDYVVYTDWEDDMESEDADDRPYRHILRFGSNPDYRTKARLPYDLRGKIPAVIGRKNAPSLGTLSRLLGLGGVPARKATKDSTQERTEA